MKLLTKIKLIKWHYFEDITLDVQNSILLTGENGCGKSTILDAIQLILTTNTRKFNTAANEKSNRDLRGYVRCKIGSESKTYLRSGNVISFVALEFFDEKKDVSFVIGAKLDSPDEESRIDAKFFIEECVLDDLEFVKEARVVTDREFIRKGKKIELINRLSYAKERIQKRLGNLDNKFFDLIPKSLAFKPMDNVKDFINKFMLEEHSINVEQLREGIENLKTFEKLMKDTEVKIISLQHIDTVSEEIVKVEKESKSIEILILKAKLESAKEEYATNKKELQRNEQGIVDLVKEIENQIKIIEVESGRKSTLISDNELRIIENLKRNISEYKRDKESKEQICIRLKNEVDKLLGLINYINDVNVKRSEIIGLIKTDISYEQKSEIFSAFAENVCKAKDTYARHHFLMETQLEKLNVVKSNLINSIQSLQKKQFIYPIDSIKILKDAIDDEFRKRDIKIKPYVLCELLEIADPTWRNAIEGYLNVQRFNILVEPKYFDIALGVYSKLEKEIHTVGLINMDEIDLLKAVSVDSLAYIVKSKDRYAQGFINYLLSAVTRCDCIQELKNNRISITKEGFFYQNYTIRKIDPVIFETPYIGASAYEDQLRNAKKELASINIKISEMQKNQKETLHILDKFDECKLDLIKEDLYAPHELKDILKSLDEEESALKIAENNPDIVNKINSLDQCEAKLKAANLRKDKVLTRKGEVQKTIEEIKASLIIQENNILYLQDFFEQQCNEFCEESRIAIEKLNVHLKSKKYFEVSNNFSPRLQSLKNQKEGMVDRLKELQLDFNQKFGYDFARGFEYANDYANERFKLVNSQITEYREALEKAKERCEKEFKDSFLSQMRENIEAAKQEFKDLNQVLKDVCYGGEYYKFEIAPNKMKEQLYHMVTDEINLGSNTIFGSEFEKKYKDEMDDLFAKLTVSDGSDEKTLKEYSDYRNYLDYDIEVAKNGEKHKFSKIYGEKSGGETQTPYYVAIAASFHQIFNSEDTIRIIMLDEAFDKMDDGRISAMMSFFKTLNFQIIMATTPAKMEVIGEFVGTILLVQRINNFSIVSRHEMGADS